MPITGHLVELRNRLIKVVAAVLAGSVLGMVFARQFLELLIAPMGDARPQSLRPTENVIVYPRRAGRSPRGRIPPGSGAGRGASQGSD